jgi:hypothetical protein
MGAVRLRQGAGEKHERFVGHAYVLVKYKGPKKDPTTKQLRPAYDVVITVGRLKHKLSVGGSLAWHEQSGLPSSPDAIDEIASSAVGFAVTPDEDVPEDVRETINSATEWTLKEDGKYDVKRTP